jgi:hypothetical protein
MTNKWRKGWHSRTPAFNLPFGTAEKYCACALAARAHGAVATGTFVVVAAPEAGGVFVEGVLC